MTLNLNGGLSSPSSSLLSSPTTPKQCNLPSLIPPLTPTPVKIDKNTNKNESVTVTHFSDLHGGVVEKISVPATNGNSIAIENGNNTEFAMARLSNNPFVDEILTTTIITTATTTSPTIKISTNPFLRSSFNANERIDKITEKSVKISFAIGSNTSNGSNVINPFEISDKNVSDANGNDELDNEKNLTSISSVNIDNEINVTKIQMDTIPLEVHTNGTTIATKKVCHSHCLIKTIVEFKFH